MSAAATASHSVIGRDGGRMMSSYIFRHLQSPKFARGTTVAVVAVVVAGGVVAVGAATATSSPTSFRRAVRIGDSTPVLVNSSHHALYLLSSEKSAHLHCTGACLTYWPRSW